MLIGRNWTCWRQNCSWFRGCGKRSPACPVSPFGCHLHCWHHQWSVFNEGGEVAYDPKQSLGIYSCFQKLALNARYSLLPWYFFWVVLLLVSFTFCVTLLHVLLLLSSSQFCIFFALETQIYYPFIPSPLLQFKVGCSLPKGSSSLWILFSSSLINMTIRAKIK